MTYEEAVNTTITASEARTEIEKHDCSWSEFLEDIGEKQNYTGSEVLGWLGY